MTYLVLLCIATCTPHTASAFGADGSGHAFYVESGQRVEIHATAVSLTGAGATFTMADEVFQSSFEEMK